MNDLLEKGLLVLVLAVIATVAGIVFLVIVFTGVATLLGNLTIWPIMGAALIGQPITFPMAIGIAAVMAVAIFFAVNAWPSQSDRVQQALGALMSIGIMSTIAIFFLGFPLWFLLVWLNGGQRTGWAIFPCGIVTAIVLYFWMQSRPADK